MTVAKIWIDFSNCMNKLRKTWTMYNIDLSHETNAISPLSTGPGKFDLVIHCGYSACHFKSNLLSFSWGNPFTVNIYFGPRSLLIALTQSKSNGRSPEHNESREEFLGSPLTMNYDPSSLLMLGQSALEIPHRETHTGEYTSPPSPLVPGEHVHSPLPSITIRVSVCPHLLQLHTIQPVQ